MYVCVCVYVYMYVRVCVFIYIYIYREREREKERERDLFRLAPLKECNTTCFSVHFGNFFIIGNAVTCTISGFPLHLHLQFFEHLKPGGVQFVKSL